MTRILADLPDEEIKRLDRIAKAQGKSRAAVVREAVSAYRVQARAPDISWVRRDGGSWKGRTDITDSVEWQRRERAGTTRPWDDDYEQVKVEFPELFDEDDDAERARYLSLTEQRERRAGS
jgi:Ribbon-helix-helix protein, copG family